MVNVLIFNNIIFKALLIRMIIKLFKSLDFPFPWHIALLQAANFHTHINIFRSVLLELERDSISIRVHMYVCVCVGERGVTCAWW